MTDNDRDIQDEVDDTGDEGTHDEGQVTPGEGDSDVHEEHEHHLHPEPLAMDVDDVIHALDVDRWTPDDPHDDEDFPFIESDVQAPPG